MRIPQPRFCDACGRPLESGQEKFCTDMCRVGYFEVFSACFSRRDPSSDFADEEEMGDNNARRSAGRGARDEDDGEEPEDDDEELGQGTHDSATQPEQSSSVAKEAANPSALQSSLPSKSDLGPRGDALRDEKPALHVRPAPQLTVAWERVPHMERYVGIAIKGATCRGGYSADGDIAINMMVELTPLVLHGANSVGSCRLTAVAEDAAGDFLGWATTDLPPAEHFPPIFIIGQFTIAVAAWPTRLRIYPERC